MYEVPWKDGDLIKPIDVAGRAMQSVNLDLVAERSCFHDSWSTSYSFERGQSPKKWNGHDAREVAADVH